MVTCSEATGVSADPNLRTKYSFRAARCGIHDAAGAAAFMANVSKKSGLTKWASISPDYEYGRDSTDLVFTAMKHFDARVQIVAQVWPKVSTTDYSSHIRALLKEKPDAIYSSLFGGDLAAFIEQALTTRLFEQSKFFAINLGDFSVIQAVKGLPEGLYSGSRCHMDAPNTASNKKFFEDYKGQYGELPINWSQECYTGMKVLAEAIRKAGTTETEAVVKALKDLTMKVPWGMPPYETVTMRGRDHTLVNYATGWGRTISAFPFVVDVKLAPWDEILKYEEVWLEEKGWR